MSAPRICVLRAPGTNCDVETAHAFELAGGQAERVHLFRLLEEPGLLKSFQMLCIPGGFSYGDDIGAGVVFGSQLQGHLGNEIGEFLAADKLVLGICNGFQVLVKAGILPGGATTWPPQPNQPREVTLTRNHIGRSTATWVHLRSCSQKNVFLRGIDRIELPVAHAEGRLCVSDPAVLNTLHEQGQIALAYTNGETTGSYSPEESLLGEEFNPNGAIGNIAGLGDPSGRVLGLMPHPDRYLFATHLTQWTRRRLTGAGEGHQIFSNAIEYFTAR
ncbi:MAG: phosphoribosylformylglycinamidine synthase subunit PurQ [Planctomycetaceae bacterium]